MALITFPCQSWKTEKSSPVTRIQVSYWTRETRLNLNSREPQRSMKILIGNILHQHAETCGMCSTFFPSIGLTGNKNSVKEASASGETDSWSAVQTAGEALTALWVTEPCAALLSDRARGALSHTSCQPPRHKHGAKM